jgi:hypothetical protein
MVITENINERGEAERMKNLNRERGKKRKKSALTFWKDGIWDQLLRHVSRLCKGVPVLN